MVCLLIKIRKCKLETNSTLDREIITSDFHHFLHMVAQHVLWHNCSVALPPSVHQAARCDCCKVQGNLTESVQWRSEMKHFCDQQCLLRFYCQQNEPNMATQKGPENTALGTFTTSNPLTCAHLCSPV